MGYQSAGWYRARGAVYFVDLAKPLTRGDILELREIADSINRSFIIQLAAILEEHDVIPYGTNPDTSLPGGEHTHLVKLLRHRFAHGEWEYDDNNPKHRTTRALFEKLFPRIASRVTGFDTSIDTVLEPVKDGVLLYISGRVEKAQFDVTPSGARGLDARVAADNALEIPRFARNDPNDYFHETR